MTFIITTNCITINQEQQIVDHKPTSQIFQEMF